MSEFKPVYTLFDVDSLDSNDMMAGYRSGRNGDPEPGNDKSRGFWHGWRNGMADTGRMEIDKAMRDLARDVHQHQPAWLTAAVDAVDVLVKEIAQ